jgi:hypothetical protein
VSLRALVGVLLVSAAMWLGIVFAVMYLTTGALPQVP